MKHLLLFIILFFTLTATSFSLPAFPGAMGMGADTIGGRGGDVYTVDTLIDVVDSGDGLTSFREAVEASGPRIVVFAVSGIIALQDILQITNPYITIAGQTSPGGISLAGERLRIYKTHDVVIRHMRFRVGYSNAGNPDADMDNFQIWGDANLNSSVDPQYHSYNIVVDHCSFAYSIDEAFETAYTVYDITISNNLIGMQWNNPAVVNPDGAEGNHAYGSLLWEKYTAAVTDTDYTARITVLGNVYISNLARQPEISYDAFFDLQNNIAYDHFGGNSPGLYSRETGRNFYGNAINNYTLGGPQSNTQHGTISVSAGLSAVYTEGNTGCTIPEGDSTWCAGAGWQQELTDISQRSPTKFTTTGVYVSTSPITTKAAALAVVQSAGASVPNHDSIDLELIDCFVNETSCTQDGAVPYPSGWPTYATPAPPTDTDLDGMPDSWECTKGLNPAINDSTQDKDEDGYTNIENYLHDLTDKSFSLDLNCIFPPNPIKIE